VVDCGQLGGRAFLRDKKSGVWFDFDKMHILRHKEHFTVRGP